MMADIFVPGLKMELVEIKQNNDERKPKVYASQVCDTKENEKKLEISMPIIEGRIVPLPVGGKYIARFFCDKGLYQCVCEITDRFKTGGLFFLVIEVKSDLKKFQRRQYFRFETQIPIKVRPLSKEEENNIRNTPELLKAIPKQELVSGTTIDISGGGMKLYGPHSVPKGTSLYIEFSVILNESIKTLRAIAEVIETNQVKNRNDVWHIRIEYTFIIPEDRELLIKYIFEEERRIRKHERQV